jgi:hypothetical protein
VAETRPPLLLNVEQPVGAAPKRTAWPCPTGGTSAWSRASKSIYRAGLYTLTCADTDHDGLACWRSAEAGTEKAYVT